MRFDKKKITCIQKKKEYSSDIVLDAHSGGCSRVHPKAITAAIVIMSRQVHRYIYELTII